MFIDKPAFNDKANTVDELANVSYNKLQRGRAGPFQIIKMQLHTVVLDGEEVPKTVLIHNVTAAPGVEEQRFETVQTPSSRKNDTHMTQHKRTKRRQ